jgi:RimJ/RimL family protein N-acetyltransferase
MQTMSFRRATIDDAPFMVAWRNDPLTLAMSRHTEPVTIAWLSESLAMPGRTVWVAECDGEPVGTMRTDDDELSWTIAPNCRGQGYGKRMVGEFIRQFPGRYRAEIKAANEPSLRIAKALDLDVTVLADAN